jgi:hypothetical protein
MKILGTILLLVVVARPDAAAQGSTVPEVVVRGLDAYHEFGRDSALAIWTHSWDRQRDSASIASLRNGFADADRRFGPLNGSDMLGQVEIGRAVRRVYTVLRYQIRPIFARFDLYADNAAWRVTNITSTLEPEQVIPLHLVTWVDKPACEVDQ